MAYENIPFRVPPRRSDLSYRRQAQTKLGDDKLYRTRRLSHSVIDARYVSESNPYMRTER
jgi:hypothetical protein